MEGLDSISYDLYDNFILGVTKVNGSEVIKRGNTLAFRNKAEICRIDYGSMTPSLKMVVQKSNKREAKVSQNLWYIKICMPSGPEALKA